MCTDDTSVKPCFANCMNVEGCIGVTPGCIAENQLMFTCPPSNKGMVIKVFHDCLEEKCHCKHYIGGVLAPIKPCRVASRLFKDQSSSPSENYSSILIPEVKEKMDILIEKELAEGFIEIVKDKPKCSHSLGAIVVVILDCIREAFCV